MLPLHHAANGPRTSASNGCGSKKRTPKWNPDKLNQRLKPAVLGLILTQTPNPSVTQSTATNKKAGPTESKPLATNPSRRRQLQLREGPCHETNEGSHMARQWVALVSGNMDQNLGSNSWWFNFDPYPHYTPEHCNLYMVVSLYLGVGKGNMFQWQNVDRLRSSANPRTNLAMGQNQKPVPPVNIKNAH